LIRTIDEKQDKIMSMLKTLTNSSDVWINQKRYRIPSFHHLF
jgi:hypothetical protein